MGECTAFKINGESFGVFLCRNVVLCVSGIYYIEVAVCMCMHYTIAYSVKAAYLNLWFVCAVSVYIISFLV